jgi:hypothetical protein
MALGYGLDDWGFESRQRLGIFLITTASRRALEPTQPPFQWVPGALSLGQSGRGVKLTTHLQLVPRSKNAWSYTSTPQYVFMAWCSVKKSTGTTLSLPFVTYYTTSNLLYKLRNTSLAKVR